MKVVQKILSFAKKKKMILNRFVTPYPQYNCCFLLVK